MPAGVTKPRLPEQAAGQEPVGIGADAAAGSQGRREEEVVTSSSRSIESTQRAGIVMTPLAWACSGSPRSPTLWHTTFTFSLSLSSQPTEAHSTAFGSPTSTRKRQDEQGDPLRHRRRVGCGGHILCWARDHRALPAGSPRRNRNHAGHGTFSCSRGSSCALAVAAEIKLTHYQTLESLPCSGCDKIKARPHVPHGNQGIRKPRQ